MTEPSISWKAQVFDGVNCQPGNGWFGCPTLYIGNPKLIGNSTSLRIYPWHNRNWSSQPMSKSRIRSMTSQLFNTTMEIRNHIFTASFGGMRWFIRKNKNASQKVYVEVMLQKRKNLKKKTHCCRLSGHKIQPTNDHRNPHLGERRPKLSCGSYEGISRKDHSPKRESLHPSETIIELAGWKPDQCCRLLKGWYDYRNPSILDTTQWRLPSLKLT